MLEHTELVKALREKAKGQRNSVGFFWGDWLCTEAANVIEDLTHACNQTSHQKEPETE